MLRVEFWNQFRSSCQRPASRPFRVGLLAAVAFGVLVAGPLEAYTNMRLQKSASPEPVATGNPLTYTLDVHCNGSEDALDVVVTDTLPTGVTFVSATGTGWTCNEAAGTVTCDWDAGTMVKGTSSEIIIVVTAPGTPTAVGSPLVNYAVTVPANLDPSEQNNDDTAETNVVAPGFTVTPTSGLVTDEDGAFDTFSVVLNAPPFDDVVVSAVSDTPAEGVAAPSPLTFTTANWNIPQIVTVTGQDDILADGDVAYIIVNTFTTTDTAYGALDSDTAVDDVSATNIATNSNEILDGAFFTVSPCRVLDTRVAGGAFTTSGETRTYPTGLGDEIVACGVSGTASAVSLNITVAEATGNGDFNVYANGVTPEGGATILPFFAGKNRANNAVVALSTLGELVAEVNLDGGQAHLIIDVNGFFE